MSLDQANAFRDYVSQNEDVHREMRSVLMTDTSLIRAFLHISHSVLPNGRSNCRPDPQIPLKV